MCLGFLGIDVIDRNGVFIGATVLGMKATTTAWETGQDLATPRIWLDEYL